MSDAAAAGQTVAVPPPLRRTPVEDLTIRRRRRGRGFEYLDTGGRRPTDADTLARIHHLALPPAYRAVRISHRADPHLPTAGRDDARRLTSRPPNNPRAG